MQDEQSPLQEGQIPEAMQRLSSLFPPTSTLLSSTPDTANSMFWTQEELGQARQATITRYLKAGWIYVEGLLKKNQRSIKPTTPVPMREPGDAGYNPNVDAFALRLGATLIRSGPWAGRYRMGDHVMRWDGSFVEQDECPGCGSRGPDDIWPKFHIRVFNPNPKAPRWQQLWAYCPVCVTPEMLAQRRREEEAHALTTGQRRR